MECKNCDLSLRTDYSYCSNCGAKIIRNPLTLKNLWYDFTERYFNVDNTFVKTFWHLFKKPEVVIEGYINGVRKKYLNPISYYAIALTLTGILLFLIKEFFFEQTSMEWMSPESGSQNKDLFENTIKYQTIISVASIPVYAILSKIMFFRNKKLNYTGHVIINIYLFAQYTIASFSLILLALLLGVNYMKITYVGILFQILYVAYSLKRIFHLSLGKIIWKTFVFIMLMLLLLIVFTILFALIMYLTGGIEALNTAAKTAS